jgi:hypothetical protein
MDPQIHMHTCTPSQNTLQGQKTTKNIQLLKFAKGWDALNYLTEMVDLGNNRLKFGQSSFGNWQSLRKLKIFFTYLMSTKATETNIFIILHYSKLIFSFIKSKYAPNIIKS